MAFLHSQDRQEPSVLLPKPPTGKLPNIPQASTSVKTPMTEDAHAQELQDKAKKKKQQPPPRSQKKSNIQTD
jgi:hypothetical protein